MKKEMHQSPDYIDFSHYSIPESRKNDPYEDLRVKTPLKKKLLIEPVFDPNPEFIELYYKAWELAYGHVLYREDSPQPFYIDEAMTPKRIWIWDTCFMALYCRYAPDQFPGIQSLNNFYYIMHDGASAPYRVHHPDNPPLFAWVEWEYFKITGDIERLKWILLEKQYLQKHFYFIENAKRRKLYKYAGVPLYAQKERYGFRWSGISSGMDNTPRGRGKYSRILWVDLAAQQALSAYYIVKIAQLIKSTAPDLGEEDQVYLNKIIGEFTQFYEEYKQLLNTYYWDPQYKIYFDIYRRFPRRYSRIITPASFWPILAYVADKEKVENMKRYLEDPDSLGGEFPVPSVERKDKDFDPRGQYWRGGIWLPTSYMTIKAIERAGFQRLADDLARKMLTQMNETYKHFEPHTIWEAYCPTQNAPSTYKRNSRLVRPDFCGWSALGPISLFIENIIGIAEIDALNRKIHWHIDLENIAKTLPQAIIGEGGEEFKIGLKNLRFGYEKDKEGKSYTDSRINLDIILRIPAKVLSSLKNGTIPDKVNPDGMELILEIENRSSEEITIILSGDFSNEMTCPQGHSEYKIT